MGDGKGWCHKNGKSLLVYEYMPNGSLDKHLFNDAKSKPLRWTLRHKIISGVAAALHYLHNENDQKVVHRDVTASNILLDSDFNARLGDFGLARALENEKTSYADSEGVAGTLGYIAPEYFDTGKATKRSDVYAFGAVLLEVVCGIRSVILNGGCQSLVDWVWALHRKGRLLEAVDYKLKENYVVEEAQRLLLLGLACSHPTARKRPKTHEILQILSGSVAVPQVPPCKPDFVWASWPMGKEDSAPTTTTNTISFTASHYESGSAPLAIDSETQRPYSDSFNTRGSSSSGANNTSKVAEEKVVVSFKEVETLLGKLHDSGEGGWLERIIVDAAGGGKTTLAREVYEHPLTADTFEVHESVNVSQDYEKTMKMNLLIPILELASPKKHGDYEKRSEDKLGEDIHKCLKAMRICRKHGIYRVSTMKRIRRKQHGIHQWPFRQFGRSSSWPLALRDGGKIVGPIAFSLSEFATTNNRAHLVEQDQSGSTASHYERRNTREMSDKQGLTMSLFSEENHQQPYGCKHKDAEKSLGEQEAFDATNDRANTVTAGERGCTVSNSEKGSIREALKRDCLTDVSVEGLRKQFGARCKYAAKGVGDSIAWKSVEVLGSLPLGAQYNSIRHMVQRRTLTHKHCVRIKKSQDLPRSLQLDFSGGLAAQSAIRLPEGRYIPSHSGKKIVRKTLKRKGRTMSGLEDRQQHVDREWEGAAKSLSSKRNCRQLVIHRVPTGKHISRQHGINQGPFQQKWADRKGYYLVDEIPVDVSRLSMDEKLDSRLQFMHMSQFARPSPWPSALPDGGEIVGPIVLSSSEFATANNRAHLVKQDQSGSTASHYERRDTREMSDKQGLTMSLFSVEDHQQPNGCKHKDAENSLGEARVIDTFSSSEQEAFDATNSRANVVKADEWACTVSNSEKGSMREALKRDCLINIIVEGLRKQFGSRRKDAAKGLGDSNAWKSVVVLDSLPLGAQSNSIRHVVRRRTLTHKHCVRLKKSQDLPRSLEMDFSGGLAAQSAIGLPDGRHILSLSGKKIVRKTLKRKGRTMSVHSLEDRQQHVDRKWEGAAKSLSLKRYCRQHVIHRVPTGKRIIRQHGINQGPFQQYWATRKRYSVGDERSVEVISLATDGKLVSRLQLIHRSWLGRFSPRPSALRGGEIVGPIALLSNEFAGTINGAHLFGQDQSGSTASHSGKKRTRQIANGKWINSIISLEDLQRNFGRKRRDAAENLGVCVSTLKRICRQHGIECWPSQRGRRVLKPPDPAERNASSTCKTLSTHGHTEMENEMVEFPLEFCDGSNGWNIENGSLANILGTPTFHDPSASNYLDMGVSVSSILEESGIATGPYGRAFQQKDQSTLSTPNPNANAILFPQPQVASTVMSSGNMGNSNDCRYVLAPQAEGRFEGHGSGATMPTCSDLASSQLMHTNPYTMLSIPHTTPPLTVQQDMRSVMIKAIYGIDGNTIIKFQLPLSSEISGLQEEVSKRLKFEHDSFDVKYKDEYGDLILIACDEDLRYCLKLFSSLSNQEIRLWVFDKFANTTNFCKNCRSLKRKRA